MAIHYDEKLRQDPELFALTKKANQQLEIDVGPTLSSANVVWDFENGDGAQPAAKLKLSDWAGSVGRVFAREDLESPWLSYRLIRLWGDLLENRSQKQIDKLLASLETMQEV